MKTVNITMAKLVYLLKCHVEGYVFSSVRQAIKDYKERKEFLLSSGAKLHYNPEVSKISGWFISGYAADGWDVKCYTSRWHYQRALEQKRLRPHLWEGSDKYKLQEIEKAIEEYHLALDRREHGGIAEHNAFNRICNVLGKHWERGEALKRYEAAKL